MNTKSSTEQAVEHTTTGEADHNMADVDLTPWIVNGMDTRNRSQGNPNGALSDCPLVLDLPQEVLDIIFRMLVVSDDPIRLENEGVVLQQTFQTHLQKCAFSAGDVTLWQKLFGKSDGERNHKRVARYGDKDRKIGNLDKQVIADGVCTNPFSSVTKPIEAPSVLQYRLVCKSFNHSIPDIFWKENRFWFIDAEDVYKRLRSLYQHARDVQGKFPQQISNHAQMIRSIRSVCMVWSPGKAKLYEEAAKMLPGLTSLQVEAYHTNALLNGAKRLNPFQIPGKNPLSKAKGIDTFCIAFNRFRHCTLLKDVQIVGTDKAKFATVNDDEFYFVDVDINHPRAIGPVIRENILRVKDPFMTADDLAEEAAKRKKRLADEKLAEAQRKADHKKAMADKAKAVAQKKRQKGALAKKFRTGAKTLAWKNPESSRYEPIPRFEAEELCLTEFDNIHPRQDTPQHMKYKGHNSSCERQMRQRRQTAQNALTYEAQNNFHATQYMQANFTQGQNFGVPSHQLPKAPAVSHFKQYNQIRAQAMASQALIANGSGFAMENTSHVGFVPMQPSLGNYNGQGIPMGSSSFGGMAQFRQIAQSNGGNVLRMVSANNGSMIPYQQMAPNNNDNGFQIGNLQTGGIVQVPRMLANNDGFNQAMGGAVYAQVAPVAPMEPSHNAENLLIGNSNQVGMAQQPQMGQVLNAGCPLIGDSNQSGMA